MMKEFKQGDLNLEILYALWNYLDIDTYREMNRLLKHTITICDYPCPTCGKILSPSLLELEPDEKLVQDDIQ